MKHYPRISLFLLLSAFTQAEETSRTWKNPDASKTFEAQFVKREVDAVTVLLANKKEITFGVDKLHEDDRLWLKENHPSEKEIQEAENAPVPGAVFDKLKFGDSQESVKKKLKISKIVTAGLSDTFVGRTGLNGVYRMVKPIGNVDCFLFFGWDERDRLTDITVSSQEKKAEEYQALLKPCWEEMQKFMISLYGKPMQEKSFPDIEKLIPEQMVTTHYWKLEQGGTAVLGTALVGGLYQVAIQFNTEEL